MYLGKEEHWICFPKQTADIFIHGRNSHLSRFGFGVIQTCSHLKRCMYVLTSLKLRGHIEYWSQGTHRGNSLTSHQTYITQGMNLWPQSYLSSTASASNSLSLILSPSLSRQSIPAHSFHRVCINYTNVNNSLLQRQKSLMLYDYIKSSGSL